MTKINDNINFDSPNTYFTSITRLKTFKEDNVKVQLVHISSLHLREGLEDVENVTPVNQPPSVITP